MTSRTSRSARRGFTLVEVMVASSVLALMTLAFFEGIIVAQSIARANSERLAADGFAFDLAWMKFNQDYTALRANLGTHTYSATDVAAAVPALAHWANDGTLSAQTQVYTSTGVPGVFVRSAVSWGPNGNLQTVEHRVYHGAMNRIPED